MEFSKLFLIFIEFTVFWINVDSMKNKRKCRLLSTEQSGFDHISAKPSDGASLQCSAHIQDHCKKVKITVALYKKHNLLGQLSEQSRQIEYKHKIKRVQTSDSGIYMCIFQSTYGSLNTTITLNVSGDLSNSDKFLPDDYVQIKRDRLYLGRAMKNVLLANLVGLGMSNVFECNFYSPQRNVSLNTYWLKHSDEFKYKIGTIITSGHKINITHSDSCDGIWGIDGQCENTKLQILDIEPSDQAFYTCFIKERNETMQNVHLTFSLLVDSTIGSHRNDQISIDFPQIEFSSNSTGCSGKTFSIVCNAEDSNFKMYLYKVHSSADLTRPILYMNDSILLKVRLPHTEETWSLNATDQRLIHQSMFYNHINYTLNAMSINDSGRYLCVIEDLVEKSVRWKSMYLSIESCNMFGLTMSKVASYVLFTVSVMLCMFLIISICTILHCKQKNDKIKRFPIRKMIVIEYESPIYKSFFNETTDCKTESFQSNSLLPDTNPILSPVIKIKPIKKYRRGRSYGEQFPSTSTDRTRLESTRFSTTLDNDVFECNQPASEIRKSSSFLLDSMYEFPQDHEWEFSREKLKITSRKLGEGAFGMVYEGLARDISDRCGVTRVGVKMMKDDFSDSNVYDFVKEIETMKQIGRHRHVIQLLGVCTQNGPLRVIVEFAPYGNLRDYLRSKGYKPCKMSKYPSTLSRSVLCIYALQIARGMTYLSSRSVVHRDLSARNILVGENYEMKIADFGLTRIVDYYYRKKTDGILPVKWMAPEALLEKKYTTKSDVWSYGILLWEIFSLGESPYSLILPEHVIDTIKRGVQNPQPVMANSEIYRLMQQCWNLLSEHRPHFYQIVEIWREILLRVSDEPEQNIYHPETLYLDMESEYMEPKERLP